MTGLFRHWFLMLLLITITLVSFQTSQTSYFQLLREVESKKSGFKRQYELSGLQQKDSVIEAARDFLLKIALNELFPYWYGTHWDFNGTTRVPGEGYIACGYFVTNTLTDLGFIIPRVKWAQSASEVYIKKLSGTVKRFSNVPVSTIREYLTQTGSGLYLVGLDCHVGYLAVTDTNIRFIHSNYYHPEKGVMSEDIETDNPFKDSGYRVIGKIFGDEMIRKWILSESFR